MRKTVLSQILILLFLFFPAVSLWADASPIPTDKTIPREIKIGKKVSEQVEKEYPRVHNPSQEAKLAMIANKLIPYMERDLEYNVRIIEMKEPNAFSLPGGRTYISTGMLDFLKSEDETAAILAHEFVHADRAHGIVQAARNNRLNLLTLAGMIAATQGGGIAAAMMASALQTALMGSYSIELEKEADAKGINVMYKAGYNPAAMLTTMERLMMERIKRVYVDPGIYQSHPNVEERVAAALRYMKDNGIEVQRKDVVHSLKVEVLCVSGDVCLNVDGIAVLKLQETPESFSFFKELRDRLDNFLELELAPYDIRVSGAAGEERLLIKGKILLTKGELLSGMPSLYELRKIIIDALANARRVNPLTDYYQ